LGHGDTTTINDKVTSMKEEELHSILVIEPLLVSDEVVAMME
jgi:hypothetical protein